MLYVVRHGQTTWNAANRICGRIDVPLTELGRQQATQLGEKLASLGVAPTLVLASPLSRAQETARLICDQLGVTEIHTDERLLETNFGQIEGIDCNSELYLSHKSQFVYRYPDGESIMQAGHRIYGLLDELREMHRQAKANESPEPCVMLVCHGGTTRILNTYFEDLTNQEFFDWRIGNAEALTYSFDV